MRKRKPNPKPEQQLEFGLRPRTWGGARPGAGRPKQKDSGVPHLRRPPLNRNFPVHITARVLPHVYNLRSKRCFAAIHGCLLKGGDRFGFRVVHYSVQGNHIHLISEANDRRGLRRGMQGLLIRIAKALNRVMEVRGKVFSDRYHSRILRTPTEVNRALAYVLKNARRHGRMHGRTYGRNWVDPYSSAAFFGGFRGLKVERCSVFPRQPDVRPPLTWLLRKGWRKAGRITPDGVPGRFG